MDITPASGTEPFFRFDAFHIGINRTVKIAGASFECVNRMVSGARGPNILESLISATGEPWGTSHHYREAKVLIAAARAESARSYTVRVFSALEIYLDRIAALLHASGESPLRSGERDETDHHNPIVRFLARHRMAISPAEHHMNAVEFFWRGRNCTVHHDCTVSQSLADFAAEAVTMSSLKLCAPKLGTRIQNMIAGTLVDRELPFELWCPIFISDIARKIVLQLDREVASKVGPRGFVRMACQSLRDGSLDAVRDTPEMPKTFHNGIKYVLSRRYRIHSASDTEITRAVNEDHALIAIREKLELMFAKLRERRSQKKAQRSMKV